jgi:hypothetical protein
MPKVTDPRLLQQLNSQGQMVAPNPMFPGQMQGQALNNQGQGLQNQERAATLPFAAPKAAADASNAQTQAAVNAATAPAEIAAKTAGARKTAVEATAAERNLEATGGASDGQTKSASFYTRAIRSNQDYEGTGIKDDPGGREFLKAILPDALVNMGTSSARQQAEAAQKNFIAATLRYESGANLPPSEFETQRQIFFPAPGDSAETVALKAKMRRDAIEGLKVASGPAAPLLDQTAPAPAGSTSTTQNAPEASALIDQLVASNTPYRKALHLFQQRYPDATPFDPGQYNAALIYHRKNPNDKSGYGAAVKSVPLSQTQQRNNSLANSPLGAALSAAGGAATLGFDDEAAGLLNKLQGGDYTQGRDEFDAGKAYLASAFPKSTIAGTAAGSIVPMAGLNIAAAPKLARMLAPAERYGQSAAQAAATGASRAGLATDVGYGTAYGAGESNDNRAMGGITGGLAAFGGNLAGRGIANTLGAVVSPTGGKMAPLYDIGVRPSVGQRFGGVVGNMEEKLQSFPFLGDMIAGTRDRARDQYQVGLFNKALGEIGQKLPKGMPPGHDAHAFAQNAFKDAYDAAKSNMVARADAPLANDLGSLQRTIGTLKPDSQKVFNKVWADSVARRFGGGALAGKAFKDATSEIEQKIAKIRSSQSGDGELADALQEAVDALKGSASRNSPPEAVAAMDAADKGYTTLVQIETASKAAGGDSAELTPKGFENAVKNTNSSVRKRGYLAGNAPNTDLAEAGLRLEDKVSNSGSVDRLLPAAAIMGTGIFSPKLGALLGGYSLLNAPGMRNILTEILAPRSNKALVNAGNKIRGLSLPAGTAGSALGLGFFGPR